MTKGGDEEAGQGSRRKEGRVEGGGAGGKEVLSWLKEGSELLKGAEGRGDSKPSLLLHQN